MRIKSLLICAALPLVLSCSVRETGSPAGEPVFASTESASKVYISDGLQVYWNAGDRISLFDSNTANSPYRFKGSDGDSSGEFASDGSVSAGSAIGAIYAVYPYDSGASVSSGGVLSVNYPAAQEYAAGTVGPGTNIMVASSSDRNLLFRNAGACLVLRLFGEGFSVSSVAISGKGGEPLAGKASVSVGTDGLPAVSFGSGAAKTLTLNCPSPVALGSSEASATEFWIFLPPVSFSSGFTVTVSCQDGTVFVKDTSKPLNLGRSTVTRTVPLEVVAGEQTITYTESSEVFANPERGLYSNKGYHSAGTAITSSLLSSCRRAGRSLILLEYYLTDFMESDISSDYLKLIENNFKRLRSGGMKCILRFAYKNGHADSDKPFDASEEWVMSHIAQVRPLLQTYSDVIYVLQAGFIGSWGEWYYTSNFVQGPKTDADYLPRKRVLEALLDALPQDRQVELRTPTFKMKIYGYSLSDTLRISEAHGTSAKARVAGHNDCFLASGNDSGTYSSDSERQYWKAETRYLIMGGETCKTSEYCACSKSGSIPGAISELQDYHFSYLNMEYNTDVLNRWKSENCFDEVEKRLGYRLVLREGTFPRKPAAGKECSVTIRLQNVGFAAPMNPRGAELVLVSQSGSVLGSWPLESDPRFWMPESGVITISRTITLPAGASGQCRLCLSLPDGAPNLADDPMFAIRLANENVWDEDLGVNVLATFSL